MDLNYYVQKSKYTFIIHFIIIIPADVGADVVELARVRDAMKLWFVIIDVIIGLEVIRCDRRML